METYTPGDTPHVTAFMARRSLTSHARFFRELLLPGMRVLDCGCGPGTITSGITDCVGPTGFVAGIDANEQQIEEARNNVSADLRVASIYGIPFENGEFDAVFSHALFEHLADPARAASEILRVLRPGGIAALRSPDWDGMLAGPQHPDLAAALNAYAALQSSNGGNLRIGKELAVVLQAAGFAHARTRATYECYEPAATIGEYLAHQLPNPHASALREWYTMPSAFFAQAWCEVVARKPLGMD
jgi:SAM-dependent methyltransferase